MPGNLSAESQTGRSEVHIHVGGCAPAAVTSLTDARRLTIADSHARFRHMHGEAVPSEWSRPLDDGDPAADRWTQRMFIHLVEAGLAHRREQPMDWCESCRTLLPASAAEPGQCRQCEGTIERRPEGQWYLRLDPYAEESAQLAEHASDNGTMKSAHDRLLGRVEGVELEVHATDGTPIVVFTRFPQAIEQAKFVALSPDHPALEGWMQEPRAQAELTQLRYGQAGPEGGGLEYATLTNTGVWVQAPGIADLLPLIVSLAVDARFGPTATLGIPSADPVDERLAEWLPRAPTLHMRSQAKPSKPSPAARLRARYLPISSSNGHGAAVPAVRCETCGPVPLPLDQLPLLETAGRGCPKCGAAAQTDDSSLDPAIVGWAEMLAAVPAAERMEASFEHPELRRWLAITTTLHDAGNPTTLLSSLVLKKALRDQGAIDLPPVENAWDRELLTGTIGVATLAPAAPDPAAPPSDPVEAVAADTVRFALLYAATPTKGLGPGEFEPVLRISENFLARLRAYAEPRLSAGADGNGAAIDTSSRLRRRLAAWCDVALRKTTENFEELKPHRATRNTMLLLARIEDFEQRAQAGKGDLAAEDAESVRAALTVLIELLAPIAPSLCEELWQRAGGAGALDATPWPTRARRKDAAGRPA